VQVVAIERAAKCAELRVAFDSERNRVVGGRIDPVGGSVTRGAIGGRWSTAHIARELGE
jgi:hypothetical protein